MGNQVSSQRVRRPCIFSVVATRENVGLHGGHICLRVNQSESCSSLAESLLWLSDGSANGERDFPKRAPFNTSQPLVRTLEGQK